MCKETINNKKFTEEQITKASKKAFDDLMEELENKNFKILKAIASHNINFNKKREQVTAITIIFSAKLNDVNLLKELGYL